MNPDTGDDAEDWFAKFEREARESAQRREAEQSEGAPPPLVETPAQPAPPPQQVPPAAQSWPPQQPAAPQPPADRQPPSATPWPGQPGPQPPQSAVPPHPVAPPQQPVAPPPQPPATPWPQRPAQQWASQQPPAPQAPAQPTAPQQPAAQAPQQPAAPWEQSTQALGRVEPEPTQAMTAPGQSLEPAAPQVPTEALPPTGSDSAIDLLFGEGSFKEYLPGPDPNEAPFAGRARSKELVAVEGGEPPAPRELGVAQKVLIGVAAGLAVVLVLVGLFQLGTRLPEWLAAEPEVVEPEPEPEEPPLTELPIGPVPPGEYRWNELLGGECLDPFVDGWQNTYTVVDCEQPHAAEMVYRAWFPDPLAAEEDEGATVTPGSSVFPGVDALKLQVAELCNAAGVVDLSVARDYKDAQIQGTYPATAEQWDADPSYYCFVSQSSGEPLTGSLAIPREPEPAQPEPTATP